MKDKTAKILQSCEKLSQLILNFTNCHSCSTFQNQQVLVRNRGGAIQGVNMSPPLFSGQHLFLTKNEAKTWE